LVLSMLRWILETYWVGRHQSIDGVTKINSSLHRRAFVGWEWISCPPTSMVYSS
jgi:hypothetical protein